MSDIKVHVLHTGSVIIDEALPYHRPEDRPFAWTGLFRSKKHLVEAPVSVYLIEHPEGLVLLDTGWHTDNREHQIKNLRHQYFVNKAVLPEGQAVHEQLAKMGISPRDLDFVMLSHLHCDHADGLRHVKDAKRIMVSDLEYKAASRDHIRYLSHEWSGVTLDTFSFSESKIGAFGYSYDMFGDGRIQFVLAKGHSAGLAATVIRNNDEYIVLSSDVAYGRESLEHLWEPGVVINRQDAIYSLQWLVHMSKQEGCKGIISNHDPEIKPGIITI
ncbi:N-acyl homoserine lactonase family protein [uncultured Veillonella sp.]|uniref:N-acyl homoserine lactonase family protein n=1 Tax=uncultured Veillonella sp. TaxID=159268 RepID=UPI0026237791|nr:N-acyl homoserine lactonase family protein [uncultured Veillonella sp.]